MGGHRCFARDADTGRHRGHGRSSMACFAGGARIRIQQPGNIPNSSESSPERLDKGEDEVRMIFIVAREACERLLGAALRFRTPRLSSCPPRCVQSPWPFAIVHCSLAAALPYRLAKSIELLCEILRRAGCRQAHPGEWARHPVTTGPAADCFRPAADGRAMAWRS